MLLADQTIDQTTPVKLQTELVRVLSSVLNGMLSAIEELEQGLAIRLTEM